jgi:hypothetical protein
VIYLNLILGKLVGLTLHDIAGRKITVSARHPSLVDILYRDPSAFQGSGRRVFDKSQIIGAFTHTFVDTVITHARLEMGCIITYLITSTPGF